MNTTTAFLTRWLADVYLLTTPVLLAALIVGRSCRQPSRRLALARAAVLGSAAVVLVTLARPDPTATPVAVAPPHVHLGGVAAFCCPTDPSVSAPTAALPDDADFPWSSAALVVFLAGSAVTTVWLVLGGFGARRLLRRTTEAPAALRGRLATIVGPGRKPPRLRLCPRIGQPVVVGIVRPTIVLPTRFAGAGTNERLDAALAHEWAHVRHGDLRSLALARLLLPILFAHPAYWWLRRQTRLDQEALADARAAGEGARLRYAESLLWWARTVPARAPRAFAGSLGLGERPSPLRRRIALLLDRDFRVETSCPRPWRLGVVGIAAAFVIALTAFAPRPSVGSAADVQALDRRDCGPSLDAIRCAPAAPAVAPR